MRVNQLISWLQEKHTNIVLEMKKSNHHFADNLPNPYHLESDVYVHLCMTLLVGEKLDISTVGKIAVLFHDLGKPLSRKEKKEEKKVFFTRHEPLSAFLCLDYIEELNKQFDLNLTNEQKFHIFYAICFHIEFHKLTSKSRENGNLYAFVELFKGMPNVAKVLFELGICDSMGRFAADSHPKDLSIWDLQKQANDEMIFDNMSYHFIEKSKKPTVEVLIGLPCSGKSTYRSKNQDNIVICRDDILLNMSKSKSDYKQAFDTINPSEVNTELMNLFKENLRQQKNMILDLTNLKKTGRSGFLDNCPHYHKKAIIFLTPFSIIKKRNIERDKKENKFIPEDVLIEMMKSFDPPTYQEFDEIEVYYDGQLVDKTKF
jgi:predicted kinase